jgi:hypothetical protein
MSSDTPTRSIARPIKIRTISAETVQPRPARRRLAGAGVRAPRVEAELERFAAGDVRAAIYTSTTTGKTSGRRRVCSYR